MSTCAACKKPIDPNEKPARDKAGHLFHKVCAQRLVEQRRASKQARSSAAPVGGARSAPPDGVMSRLIDEGLQQVAQVCPSCKNAVPEGTVICVRCGLNFDTGKTISTQIVKAPKEKGERAGGGDMDLEQIVPLAIFGVIAGLGIGAYFVEALALPFLGVYAIASFGLGVWCVVAAFSTSIVTGLLYLFLPFYAIYWLFVKCESVLLRNSVLALIGAVISVFAFSVAGVGTSPFDGGSGLDAG